MSHEVASIDARTTRDNHTAVPGARPFPENSEWIDLGRVVYYPDVNLAFIKRGPLDAPYHTHTKMHAISLDEMTQRVCGEENTLPEIFERTYHISNITGKLINPDEETPGTYATVRHEIRYNNIGLFSLFKDISRLVNTLSSKVAFLDGELVEIEDFSGKQLADNIKYMYAKPLPSNLRSIIEERSKISHNGNGRDIG